MFEKIRIESFIEKIKSGNMDDFSPNQIIKKLKLRDNERSVLTQILTSQARYLLERLPAGAVSELVRMPQDNRASAVHGKKGEELLDVITDMLDDTWLKPVVSKLDSEKHPPLWDKNPVIIDKIIKKLERSLPIGRFFMPVDDKNSTLLHNILSKVDLKDEEQCVAVTNIIKEITCHPNFIDILKRENQDGQTPLTALLENGVKNGNNEEAVTMLQQIFHFAPKDKVGDLFFVQDGYRLPGKLTMLHLLNSEEAAPIVALIKQETLLKALLTDNRRSGTPLAKERDLAVVKGYLDAIPLKKWDEVLDASITLLSIDDRLKLFDDLPAPMRGYKRWMVVEEMKESQIIQYVELIPEDERATFVMKLFDDKLKYGPSKLDFNNWTKEKFQTLIHLIPENERPEVLKKLDPQFEIKARVLPTVDSRNKSADDGSTQPLRVTIDDGGRKFFTAAKVHARKTATRNT